MKIKVWIATVLAAWFVTPAFAHEAAGVHGAWDLTLETKGGPRPSWVKLFQENGAAVADFVGTGGGKNRASGVSVDGNRFQWTMGKATYHATLTDGKLTGHLVVGDRRTPFTGERVVRRADLTGTWDVEVAGPERVRKRVMTLQQDGDKISGKYGGGGLAEHSLSDGTFDHGRLTFTIDLEINGQEVTVDYDIKVRGDKLDGSVALREYDWEGEITAVRRRQWSEPLKLIGHDFSNWDFQQVGEENRWKIVDGVLVNSEKGWNIFTKQRFKDYKLNIDVRVPPGGNSGIYINGRYEVQVADTHGKPVSKGGMGAIYGRAVPTANPSKPAGEWQTFEITFVDYWATVVLNGTTIVDNILIEGITGGALDSHESRPGPLMLQGDHGPIEYRNIQITRLVE